MADRLSWFERVVRATPPVAPRPVVVAEVDADAALHPFDRRNIHPSLPPKVRRLFDDGHFAEATFHGWKFLDKVVQKHSKLHSAGFALMSEAFKDASPAIALTPLSNQSEIDEHKGYRFLFSGSVWAIRNPRGHESIVDSVDVCLDHLAFLSMLLRRLEESGFK